jgi:hypothetical protein
MRTNDQPGGRAALLAVLLGVGAAVSLLFLKVPVDEEGKALSTKEQDARDKAGKPEITDSFTEVYGPVGIVLGILPAATAGVGLYAVRARKNPRWVTGAMFGMVIASTVSRAPILFFPSLAALAVTYYQVRRSERLAQLADAPAPDDESVEEAVDEELADEHPADEDAEDAADDR